MPKKLSKLSLLGDWVRSAIFSRKRAFLPSGGRVFGGPPRRPGGRSESSARTFPRIMVARKSKNRTKKSGAAPSASPSTPRNRFNRHGGVDESIVSSIAPVGRPGFGPNPGRPDLNRGQIEIRSRRPSETSVFALEGLPNETPKSRSQSKGGLVIHSKRTRSDDPRELGANNRVGRPAAGKGSRKNRDDMASRRPQSPGRPFPGERGLAVRRRGACTYFNVAERGFVRSVRPKIRVRIRGRGRGFRASQDPRRRGRPRP